MRAKLITSTKGNKLLYCLEYAFKNGKRIILFCCGDTTLLNLFCNDTKFLEARNTELWCISPMPDKSDCIRTIPETQMKEILGMYQLYDFSDKIMVIGDFKQYGSLFNYVKTGILTLQEMVDALLYKI